jgi:hypothetical protein
MFLRKSPNERYHLASCMPAPKLKGKQPRPPGLWQTFTVDGMTTAEFTFKTLMEQKGIPVEFIGKNGVRLFKLNGTSFTPDFHLLGTAEYIEVVGTRQAYFANRKKYAMFRQQYPDLVLKIVKPDSTEILLEAGKQ